MTCEISHIFPQYYIRTTRPLSILTKFSQKPPLLILWVKKSLNKVLVSGFLEELYQLVPLIPDLPDPMLSVNHSRRWSRWDISNSFLGNAYTFPGLLRKYSWSILRGWGIKNAFWHPPPHLKQLTLQTQVWEEENHISNDFMFFSITDQKRSRGKYG